MFTEQVLPINPAKFSRCGEHTGLLADDENSHAQIQKADATLEEKINHALWKDDVLRVTDNHEVDFYVQNGIVYLNGHLLNSGNRQRVEKALQTVAGLQSIQSNFVMDDELTLAVATSLSQIEHTYNCKFFTGVSHGVVVLNGEVSSMEVRNSAEQCAARHPDVRGVINYIRVPGVDLGPQDQRFLQPPIGKEINFLDGTPGIVRQVVINPDNRRVVAMTLQGRFADPPQNLITAQPAEQLLLIPMSVMGHLTSNSGFLTISSEDSNQYQQFEAALFTAPPQDWVPPFPYCPEDVLFQIGYRQMENIPSQAQTLSKKEGLVLTEQLLVNDSLGG